MIFLWDGSVHSWFVVRWGTYLTTATIASNGVQQGGILPPLFFFYVYMDKHSIALNYANIEYTINQVIDNHLMYADDFVLIASSVHATHTLLNCRNRFACDNGVMCNNRKNAVHAFRTNRI